MVRRLIRSGIVRTIGSNVYIQIVQTASQLALVPVLASHWGVKVYGTWLMLSAVPLYLALADLGLGAAASNEMAVAVAQERRTDAAAIYSTLRLTVMAIVGTLFALAAVALEFLPAHLLAGLQDVLHGHAIAVILVLVGYGALTQVNGLAWAAYRVIGRYAVSGFITGTLIGIETIAVVTTVLMGGGIVEVAWTFLAVRIAASATLSIDVARRAPWLVAWRFHEPRAVLRQLIRPAAAVMILPVAQSLTLQGTVLAIGFVAGSSAVPAFTAVRTLSRIAIQATLIVNHAIMPYFTLASATDDHERTARFTATSITTALLLAVPAAILLPAAGQLVVRIWTHDAVHPSLGLLSIMAATTIVGALWMPISNLLLSVNKHEGFTYYQFFAGLLALALAVPLIAAIGNTGAAISLLLLDLVMLRRVVTIGTRLGVIDLRDALRLVVDYVRRWREGGRLFRT